MSKQGLGSSQVDGAVTNGGGGVVDERHHTLHYKAGILKQKTMEKEANVRARNEEILTSIKKKEEEFKKTKTVLVSESHEKSESEIIEVKKLEKSTKGTHEVDKLPFGDETKTSNGTTEGEGPNDDGKVNPFGDEKSVDSKKLEKASDDVVDSNNCASDDDETLKEDKKTDKLDVNGSTDDTDTSVVNGQKVKVTITTTTF
jgi:hypothetical protein